MSRLYPFRSAEQSSSQSQINSLARGEAWRCKECSSQPRDLLAVVLRQQLAASAKSAEEIAQIAGITPSYLSRLLKGERVNIRREKLILIGLAMHLNLRQMSAVIETLDELLDAASFKTLSNVYDPDIARTRWRESAQGVRGE